MDFSATLWTLLIYPALLVAALVCMSMARRGHGQGLPPGPRGLPLIGSLLSMDRNLHAYLATLAAKHGPIVSIRVGSRLLVVVSSPALARDVLREQDLVFASRDIPDAARSYGGAENIVGSPIGPAWRLFRRICIRELIGPAGLDLNNSRAIRRREFRATLAHLHADAVLGTPVEVGAQMFLNNMNAMTGVLWGGRIGSESLRTAAGKEFRRLVADMTEMLGAPNVSDFFPVLARLDLQGIRRKTDALKARLDVIFDRIIEERTNTDEQARRETVHVEDFLDCMLKLVKKGGDGKVAFTMANLKALLMDMVVGGTETMSNTVEWALAEMLLDRSSRAVLRKVQEELDAVVGVDAVVEESHLPQLHYLQLVVKETLRLHPPVPLMVPHVPSADATVAGHLVPAGTPVFVHAWAIMRDPAVWENPTEFCPERFLPQASRKNWDFTGTELEYFPFGSGRRICPGVAMGDRMTAYSLAMLLQAFDWELPPGAQLDLTERFGIVMKKATPLVAVPTPRLSTPQLYYT